MENYGVGPPDDLYVGRGFTPAAAAVRFRISLEDTGSALCRREQAPALRFNHRESRLTNKFQSVRKADTTT